VLKICLKKCFSKILIVYVRRPRDCAMCWRFVLVFETSINCSWSTRQYMKQIILTTKLISSSKIKYQPKHESLCAIQILLEFVVEPNTTQQNRLVRWGLPLIINTLSGHLISEVRFFNTYPSRHALLGLVRGHKWWVVRERKPDSKWPNGSLQRLSYHLRNSGCA